MIDLYELELQLVSFGQFSKWLANRVAAKIVSQFDKRPIIVRQRLWLLEVLSLEAHKGQSLLSQMA